MSRFSMYLILIIIACLTGCSLDDSSTRGRDPWVFRINLDDRARCIVLALNDELWAAYDPDRGALYKVWKGGVRFRGPVFDLLHGVQPNSMGENAYIFDPQERTQWQLKVNGTESMVVPEYLGYIWKENSVILQYAIPLNNGQAILIEETPEYITKDGRPGFQRVIKTENMPPNSEISIATAFQFLSGRDDVITDGAFTEISATETDYSWGTGFSLKGEVRLNANAATVIESYFEPKATAHIPTDWREGIEAEDKTAGQSAEGATGLADAATDLETLAARGRNIIGENDCAACHSVNKPFIGPSYTLISGKYNLTEAAVDDLAEKVIAGASGVWGTRQMTPHPNLPENDARAMVAYILSLTPDSNAELQPGVVVDYYDIGLPLASLPVISPGQTPNISKVYPTIEFESGNADLGENNDENFEGFRNSFMMHVTGFINIEKSGIHDFGLVADDGGRLLINDQVVVDETRWEAGGSIALEAGLHPFRIEYYQFLNTKALFLGWRSDPEADIEPLPASMLSHNPGDVKPTSPGKKEIIRPNVPGFGAVLESMHPSFDLLPLRPEGFNPRVGGIDFFDDGRMVICTWDGEVFIISGQETGDPEQVTYTKFAEGLAEPLGISVVDGEIFVIQRWELTHVIDDDGDGRADRYKVICDDWSTTSDFHEWAFGLIYREGYFYANLGIAQGRFYQRQARDSGKTIKIAMDGSYEFIAHGLRAPNGIGFGVDGEIFSTDNEGEYVPANKMVHIPDNEYNFYGSRSVIGEDTLQDLQEKPPVIWLVPQEIGNSPSEPAMLNIGPYKNQMIHGDVTQGGLKRNFIEKVNGQYQGAVFRFAHGFEAGVNRIAWGPDGGLYVGGLGSAQDFGWQEKQTGLERMAYNGKSTFEMLAIRAKANGMEIEFTEPLRIGDGTDSGDYLVRQWYYGEENDEFGGGKLDLEILKIRSISLSTDRKTVFLEMPGLKSGHVLSFRLQTPFISESGQQIWSNEAWYTLNEIPDSPASVHPYPFAKKDNDLSQPEKEDGWKLLFDGKTIGGWHAAAQSDRPSGWEIKEGQMSGGSHASVIVSEQIYENFELEFEWKISRGGEGGLYFAVSNEDTFSPVSLRSPRMQLIDDLNHPDARTLDTHLSGANYDLHAPRFQISKPAGEFNHARLVVKDGHVAHWLNGIKIIEYGIDSEDWQNRLPGSIYALEDRYGKAANGHIALQCNTGNIALKNFRIRELFTAAE